MVKQLLVSIALWLSSICGQSQETAILERLESVNNSATRLSHCMDDSIANSILNSGKEMFHQDRIDLENIGYVMINGTKNNLFLQFYNSDSLIFEEKQYLNGKKSGADIQYFKTGKISSIALFNNGSMCTSTNYYPTGIIEVLGFHDKVNIGDTTTITYRMNGQLASITRILDSLGNEEILNFYPDQGIMDRFQFNNEKAPYTSFYYPEMIPFQTGEIYNFTWALVGNWKEYDKQGHLARTFSFCEDQPNIPCGRWNWYNANGKVIKWEEYKDGNLIRKSEDPK